MLFGAVLYFSPPAGMLLQDCAVDAGQVGISPSLPMTKSKVNGLRRSEQLSKDTIWRRLLPRTLRKRAELGTGADQSPRALSCKVLHFQNVSYNGEQKHRFTLHLQTERRTLRNTVSLLNIAVTGPMPIKSLVQPGYPGC